MRWLELVDVLLVTALVAAAVVWLRRTQAARIAIGLFAFAALFLVARALELPLLSGIFQGSAAVMVLIIVVIFQEELRRLFESVAALGPGGASVESADPSSVLGELCFALADRGTGALFVVPGRQPLGRHLDGGVELNGKLSRAILLSIFDSSSPGHDGALVVEGDLISRFAVHLPLSTNFEILGERGTRHSAALGLSEQTDALCLVVSEERGEVCAARAGRLEILKNAGEVAARVRETMGIRKIRAAEAESSYGLFQRHWREVLASAVFVVGTWYVVVVGSAPQVREIVLPVVLEALPSGFSVESIDPPEVVGVLEGPRTSFYLADAQAYAVVVDASLARLGRRTFVLRNDDVRHPEALSVVSVKPTQIRLSLKSSETLAR